MIKHLLMTLSSTSSPYGRCLAGCIILSSVLASPALAEDCVKTFRWTDDPPYTYASADAPGGVSGISADVIRTVLSELGCDVRFVDMPWARALSALQTGRVDIVSGAFDTPERRAYAHYANQGDTSPNVIFVRADNPGAVAWQQFSDLLESDITLGGQIGVNYGPEYQQALANGDLEGRLTLVPNRPLLWQMLDRDRIDAVAASYLTGLMEISQLGFQDRIVSTGIKLSSDPAYIIFSKASVDATFVDRFNEAHNTLLQSEKYQTIVDAHTREVQVSE